MVRKAKLVETIARQSHELHSMRQKLREKHCALVLSHNESNNRGIEIGVMQDELVKLRPPELIKWEDLQEFTDYKTVGGNVITLLVKNYSDDWYYRNSDNWVHSFREDRYNAGDVFKLTEVHAEREIV